jgi:hypothetical protein
MLNEKAFRGIYDDFLGSGLSIRDYCANQGIIESKFFYWQNKLKGQLPPKSGFIPVLFEKGQQVSPFRSPARDSQGALSPMPIPTRTLCCEISYPGGVCLKLNGPVEVELLRSLLLLTQG